MAAGWRGSRRRAATAPIVAAASAIVLSACSAECLPPPPDGSPTPSAEATQVLVRQLTFSPTASIGPSPGPTPTPNALPTPARTPRPSVELNEPLLTGDASQNESCRLASVAEIQEQVGANVTEMRGLTQPGAYGETMLSCTWYLDSTEIGIPSVTVQWEYPVGIWHDPVLDLYGQLVDQELAAPVPAIGEAAILQGVNAETLAGDRILRISVLMHVTPTADDQANAIDLLRLVLGRSYEAQPSPAP